MKIKELLLILFCGFVFVSHAQNMTYAFDGEPAMVITHLDVSKFTVVDTANLQVTYKLSYLGDTLQPTTRIKDIMVLQVGRNYSKFYSQLIYLNDSVCTKLSKQTTDVPLNDPGLQAYQIFRTKNNLRVTNRMPYSDNVYTYNETIPKLRWKITTDTQTVAGYKCQHASVEFRGRTYTAWFAPDIPVNLGPWKLGGLPGLILKVSDSNDHYLFECIGIQKTNALIKDFKWKDRTITIEEWKKLEEKIYRRAGDYLKSNNVKMKVLRNDVWVNVEGELNVPYNPIER